MSLLALARNIEAIAAAHADVQGRLRRSGSLLASHVRDNIDRSQVAGQYRNDTTGTPAGSGMQPLAAYTVARRADRGVYHGHPLKDTGRTYREIGIRGLSQQTVTVGGTTTRARKLLKFNLGTYVTGILSSDLDRHVPPRNPVGYNQRVLDHVWDIWGEMVPARAVNTSATMSVRIG